MLNTDMTEISSDFDICNQETDSFDKQELIIWASKLELETIDMRSTNNQLVRDLAKLSKTLTDSLNNVKKNLLNFKGDMFETERKFKNFIELSIDEEIEKAIGRISRLATRVTDLETTVYSTDTSAIKAIEKKLNNNIKQQNSKFKVLNVQIDKMQKTLDDILSHPTKPLTPQSSCRDIDHSFDISAGKKCDDDLNEMENILQKVSPNQKRPRRCHTVTNYNLKNMFKKIHYESNESNEITDTNSLKREQPISKLSEVPFSQPTMRNNTTTSQNTNRIKRPVSNRTKIHKYRHSFTRKLIMD